MTPETPTPRTDAQPWINQYPEYHEGATRWVSANFARQLERELATKDAQADEIYKAAVNLANMLSDKLDAERALADRLAEALENATSWGYAKPAFDAWKEARK